MHVGRDGKTYLTSADIIRRREKMPLQKLRAINKACKKRFGLVYYKALFLTMGYEHAFNDTYIETTIKKYR